MSHARTQHSYDIYTRSLMFIVYLVHFPSLILHSSTDSWVCACEPRFFCSRYNFWLLLLFSFFSSLDIVIHSNQRLLTDFTNSVFHMHIKFRFAPFSFTPFAHILRACVCVCLCVFFLILFAFIVFLCHIYDTHRTDWHTRCMNDVACLYHWCLCVLFSYIRTYRYIYFASHFFFFDGCFYIWHGVMFNLIRIFV